MNFCLLTFGLAGLASCTASPFPSPLSWQTASRGLPIFVPVLAVAVDPAQPDLVIAATAAPPRLHRSRDRGATWEPVGQELDGRLVQALLALPGAANAFMAGTSDGLFRSADGGSTWQMVPDLAQPVLPPEGLAGRGRSVYNLFAGSDGAIYLAGRGSQPWRSVDGGVAWHPLAPLPAGTALLAITLSPDGGRLLAGTDGAGLFQSDDGGQTWQAAAGIPATFVAGLWFDPAGNGVAYARTRRGLYRSDDGGRTWQPSAAEIKARIDSLIPGPAAGQALLLANDGRVYETLDGGRAWQLQGDLGRSGAVYAAQSWPEAFGGEVLAATQAGLWSSSDSGRTWEPWPRGPGVAPASDLAEGPDEALYLANAGGVYRSDNGGGLWTPAGSGLPPVAALAVAVAPSDPLVLYAGTDGRGLYRSRDRGLSWTATALAVPSVPGILIDPIDPDHLWVRAVYQRIYESRDGGATWNTPWNGLDLSTELTFLGRGPGYAPLLYAAGTEALYRSADAAQSWQPIAKGLAGQTVFDLVTDPQNPQRLYAGATKGAYLSQDGGGNWAPWGRGLEEITVSALAFQSQRREQVYAGTKYSGLYRSQNGGASWQPAGLAGLSINRLLTSPDGRWLLAATNEGVWRSEIGGPR